MDPTEKIELDIFECVWMRFEAQKVLFTSILDTGGQWTMAKIRFCTKFPITTQNKQKIVFFDDFSNFLQGLRYYLGYQNSLNETYLKGSG